ncbi:hypothetical protein PV328_002299 [Microctonus aethiopoides]|uniref:C3H1-type domain-containing protein n=1 Tax=Microctonus aethiopoides TaxID=144406 RepID=A0AA39FYS7_9HYME|nr:hypothetical protein PV328_002299 [Microctonus aethiopoides]
MGEVSRISVDRSNLKPNDKEAISTIKKVFDVSSTLIQAKDGTKIEAEEMEIKHLTARRKKCENDINTDIDPKTSRFYNQDEHPLSKSTTKICQQQHVPCSLLEGNYSSRAKTVTAAETETSAEDSSYDSDNDSTSSVYSTHLEGAHHKSMSHLDISRTVSDTLAAEFADYVTVQQPQQHQESFYSNKNPRYVARVEFALKLGYTERLVQAALHKLGPEPGQDKLLAELIKLGANPSKMTDNSDENAGVMVIQSSEVEANSDETSTATNVKTCGISLRPVVIDGSNVAMGHGNKELFSCRGIKICVDWFRSRGHKEITVFVPKWRKESSRSDNRIADQDILGELERERLLVFTPSRLVNGKRLVCYDDRYILRLAAELDGIVVSNDNYRDLAQENPEFRRIVEERILMYSFVNDRFMPPDDPLGRGGPTLDNFLKVIPRRSAILPCPYAKKCTYGNKCKFRHPERGEAPQKSISEQLVEHAQRHLKARGPSLSLPLPTSVAANNNIHRPLSRTKSVSQCSTSQSNSQFVEKDTMNTIAGTSSYAQRFVNWQTQCVRHSEPETTNVHKKLQRQLTLNPNCDLRLYHLKRHHHYQQPSLPAAQGDSSSSRMNIHHKLLMSNDKNNNQNNKNNNMTTNKNNMNNNVSNKDPLNASIPDHYNHKHVTRIASAPDSYLAWPPTLPPLLSNPSQLPHGNQRLGMSDSQLNLLSHTPMSMPNLCMSQDTQIYDARRHLHYHLSNIFPDEQVQVAMTLHPHETNPQQICATILSMFPKLYDR